MLMRFGFEIDIESAAPVPMLLALSTHSGLEGRMIGRDYVRLPEGCPGSTYLDRFGNRITRIVAPNGPLRLWSDSVIEIDGAPDIRAPSARQLAIPDLPNDVLQNLMASRYCDSDNLTDQAWSLFAGNPEGWPRVQAIGRHSCPGGGRRSVHTFPRRSAAALPSASEVIVFSRYWADPSLSRIRPETGQAASVFNSV